MYALLVVALLVNQASDDPAARRAAGELFLRARTQACGTAAGTFDGWPGTRTVAVTTDIFFAQPVDEALQLELERSARDMVSGVLQPLGVMLAAEGSQPEASVAFTGIAEALTADGKPGGTAFNGAWWHGAISLHARGSCVFARPFERRVQTPMPASGAAVASASDAPFLDVLEPPFIDALIETVETIRGQAGLARLASSDADSRVCLQALAKITDQALLIGLARTAKAVWVRVPAVRRLEDVSRLSAIAKNDPSAEVREAARARMAELKKRPGRPQGAAPTVTWSL